MPHLPDYFSNNYVVESQAGLTNREGTFYVNSSYGQVDCSFTPGKKPF